MALNFLIKIKESKEVSLKNLIHSELAGWERPREDGLVHASDLMKEAEFCPRELAFVDLGMAKKKSVYVGTALRITFDYGRDLENHIRNDWLRKHVLGFWRCGVCGHTHKEFGPAPKHKCPICNYGHQWNYREVMVEDPETGISGSLDILVRPPGALKIHLGEIKSISPDEFKKLLAPLGEHRVRTSLYLDLVERSDLPFTKDIDTTKASVLYATRSFGTKDPSLKAAGISDAGFSPLKEFVVPRDPSIKDLIDTSRSKAKVITVWRKGMASGASSGFPCGVCSNVVSKRAQGCCAVSPCFSGKFMGTMTWKEKGVIRHAGKPTVIEVS